MPLATGEILKDALRDGYAVPAFSVHTNHMVETILEEAERQSHPVMLQIGQRAIRNGQLQALTDAIRQFAKVVHIPVVIHLDHCHTFEQVVLALRAGFTSCMIDASSLPFEENVARTQEVVRLCHAVSVPVEGELGSIGGVEDDVAVADEDVLFTSVEAAVEYASRTGVDSLAVAIGSAHGMYRGVPRLDFDRLREIHAAVGVPLVLHGGSGIPDPQLRQAIDLGIAKINFDTELRLAYTRGLREGAEAFPDDPFPALRHAGETLQQVVRERILVCRGPSR